MSYLPTNDAISPRRAGGEIFLKILFWLALCLLLGGWITLGALVAPTLFQVLRAALPLQSPEQLAGEIFGQILGRFGRLETICLSLMLAILFFWNATRPQRRYRLGLALVILLGGAHLYDRCLLTPRLLEQRESWRQAAARQDPRASELRVGFDTLHHRSERLGKLRVLTLVGLLILAAGGALGENRR